MQILVRLFGILLMLTALAVTLTHAPDRSVESLVARWAPPPSDFLLVKGQLVHYRDEGPRDDPAPLVLLHGVASSLHTWQGWAGALRGRRRVIAFDLPGAGLTGPFGADGPAADYRPATLARFTLDVLDALQVRRFVVGGNTLGGEVAWRIAAGAPDRVAALVLVDPFGEAFTPERLPAAYRLAVTPGLNRIGRHLTPRAVVEDTLQTLYADPARVSGALVDRYFELLTREGNRAALGQVLHDSLAAPAPADLHRVAAPTLILWGAADRFVPVATARLFQQAIAGSQLVVLPNLGDLPQEEDAGASVAPVARFLDALPPPAARGRPPEPT